MDKLTLFGLVAVILMLISFAFQRQSRWFLLGEAASSLLGAAYGVLQGAWPLALIAVIWGADSLYRWYVPARKTARI